MLEIYTDGSSKKDGKSGYGIVATQGGTKIGELSKPVPNSTNQQMELTAAIKGCLIGDLLNNRMGTNYPIVIYSDSAYLINCYKDGWWKSWVNNGWKNAKKKPVANKELWEDLIPFFKNPHYTFKKVEGHSGDKWNTVADALAQDAADHA